MFLKTRPPLRCLPGIAQLLPVPSAALRLGKRVPVHPLTETDLPLVTAAVKLLPHPQRASCHGACLDGWGQSHQTLGSGWKLAF